MAPVSGGVSGGLGPATDPRLVVMCGPYRLVRRVGEGATSVVHLGVAPDGREVAVKVLKPHLVGDEQGLARFVREVRATRRVRGRHVVEVLDAAVDADVPYLVTRFVDGPSLHDAVRERGPMPLPSLLVLGAGLADALADIHAAGLIHRDLKPGNVLLDRDVPVVVDFGIAQLADDSRLTSTGLFVGTPGYLPPEVLDGGPAGAASDVHAWAATVAYAATGRPLFGSGPLQVVLAAVLQGRADLAGVPTALLPVLQAALAVDPLARPTAADLRRWCEELQAAELTGAAGPDATVTTTLPAVDVTPTTTVAAADVTPTTTVSAADVTPTTTLRAAPSPALPTPAAGTRYPVSHAPGPHAPGPHAPGPHPPGAPLPFGGAAVASTPAGPPVPGQAQLAPRHLAVLVPLWVLVVALGAVLPFVAVVVLLLVSALLRGADGAALAAVDRRWRRGPRPSDGALTAVTVPWHVLRGSWAALVLVLVPAVLGAMVGGITWASVQLLGGPASTWALVVGFAVGVGTMWRGRRGAPLRRPTVWAVDRVLPDTRRLAITATALSVLSLVGVLVVLAGAPPVWWPVSRGA